MAKVRCEFCSNYIDETSQTCPNCGAVNPAYMRMAHDTPKTISELQSWYRARNLPPESTTRFFIGKNVTEPKAFGIYEANGTFVVYKNKANGERAIRYRGTDEAYAVNEMYMKLKEIILQQKVKNSQPSRQPRQQQQIRSHYSAPSSYPSRNTYPRTSHRRHRSRAGSSAIIAILIMVVIFGIISFVGATFVSKLPPSYNYYYLDGDSLYYVTNPSKSTMNSYEWWKYDNDLRDWALYTTTSRDQPYPDALSSKSPHTYSLPFSQRPDFSDELYNIRLCHAFVDLYPQKPSRTNSYYDYDGHIYYFLDDTHGGSYGTSTNRTGWYIYSEDDDDWEYYCAYDDKETLGEDLWYNNDAYELSDWSKATWNTSFYDTEFYHDYQTANDSYNEYQSNRSYYNNDNNNNWDDDDNNWDNDNDWDWDDNDDWDNNDMDWDSDW